VRKDWICLACDFNVIRNGRSDATFLREDRYDSTHLKMKGKKKQKIQNGGEKEGGSSIFIEVIILKKSTYEKGGEGEV